MLPWHRMQPGHLRTSSPGAVWYHKSRFRQAACFLPPISRYRTRPPGRRHPPTLTAALIAEQPYCCERPSVWAQTAEAATSGYLMAASTRGSEIRTHGLLDPNQALCQAELCPVAAAAGVIQMRLTINVEYRQAAVATRHPPALRWMGHRSFPLRQGDLSTCPLPVRTSARWFAPPV